MGPIGSGWPQIGFKFGFNPIMYLIKFGLSRVGFVGFIWPHYNSLHRAHKMCTDWKHFPLNLTVKRYQSV